MKLAQTKVHAQQAPPGIAQPSDLVRMILAAAAVLLVASFLAWPINRDEGQYVAATEMMRHGLPFRDFPYLQTPLQPLLLTPLAWLPAGWLLVASRLFNTLCGWASLLIVARATGKVSIPKIVALTVVAMASAQAFQFASAVARNDALPMLLLSSGTMVLLDAIDRHGRRPSGYLIAGLLFGLATSAKISFAIPAAGAGLALLIVERGRNWRAVASLLIGGLAGLLPTLALAAVDPQRFMFDVFTYSLQAPQQAVSTAGNAVRLAPGARIWKLIEFAARGAALPALLIVAADRRREPRLIILDLMIVGGLIAAFLPVPAYVQYLVPSLPPLFIRFALALEGSRGGGRKVAVLAVCSAALFGFARETADLIHRSSGGLQLQAALSQGRMTARVTHGGMVVTLSPERVAGGDVALDPGFVTGPFLFRTNYRLGAQAWQFHHSPTWLQAAQYLDAHPPVALLTGAESDPTLPFHPDGLDGHLIAWANSHGYRAVALPGRGISLYLRQ